MAMGSLFLIVAAIALLAALTLFIITGSYNVRH
jgi:hypothetical protein